MGTANFKSVAFGLFVFDPDESEWEMIEREILQAADECKAFDPCSAEFRYYPDEYGGEEYPINLKLVFDPGYYSGIQVYVNYDEREEHALPRELDALISQDMIKFKHRLVEIGATRLACIARFSNGEAWYQEKINNKITD